MSTATNVNKDEEKSHKQLSSNSSFDMTKMVFFVVEVDTIRPASIMTLDSRFSLKGNTTCRSHFEKCHTSYQCGIAHRMAKVKKTYWILKL